MNVRAIFHRERGEANVPLRSTRHFSPSTFSSLHLPLPERIRTRVLVGRTAGLGVCIFSSSGSTRGVHWTIHYRSGHYLSSTLILCLSGGRGTVGLMCRCVPATPYVPLYESTHKPICAFARNLAGARRSQMKKMFLHSSSNEG